MKLTPNFHANEFMCPGANYDTLPADARMNIIRLAERLQVLRDLLGKPITITSGYRTPEHNAKVGGGKNSYHVKGMAADIVIAGLPPKAVQEYLKKWSGGLGSYTTFTHIDIGPKRRWGG